MSELERWIGACIVPELRVRGTSPGHPGGGPDAAYLERFPPAGVIVFGRTPAGPGDPEPALARLRAACEEAGGPRPFACCDLEQGAGLHFAGATRLPPALALGRAGHAGHRSHLKPGPHALARAAGELTGREARARGVDLVLAPVCDIDSNPANPIIAVRSFGAEPAAVTAGATAFLHGLHAGGVGGCAKHWPGHGDTACDSHLELPRVERTAEQLSRQELVPFRALAAAGVDTIMVGHLDVPALTGTAGVPATLSPAACAHLREEGERAGFEGAVLTDGIDMGALAAFPERYAQALAAGCDGLLCPEDPRAAAEALLRAVGEGRLEASRLERAAAAMESLRLRLFERRASGSTGASLPTGRELAGACLWSPRPAAWAAVRSGRGWEALEAFPGSGTAEARGEISNLIMGLRPEAMGLRPGGPGTEPPPVLLIATAETLAGRREVGLSGTRTAALERQVGDLSTGGRPVGVLWLASPSTLPAAWQRGEGPAVLVGFAPTPPMVRAALDWLRNPARSPGSGGSRPRNRG